MLEARSAIASVTLMTSDKVSLRESPDFALIQYSWFGKSQEKSLKQSLGALPAKVGIAAHVDDATVFRTGPLQLWFVGDGPESLPPDVVATPLSSSRCRMELAGAGARDVLTRCAAMDFDASVFKPGQFVMTGIHHTPVLIHCVSAERFHIYAMRSFALAVWEWLEDASRSVHTG